MKTPIKGSDYCVRILDFPDSTISGAVSEDEDGFYCVYINSRVSWEKQRKSFLHEISHIANDDFHNGLSVAEIEGRDSE